MALMVELDKDNLEKALNKVIDDKKEFESQLGEMTKEGEEVSSFLDKNEEIGFHKGSLNTLAAERNELIKMIGNVEAIMQAHMKRLKELGVEIDKK